MDAKLIPADFRSTVDTTPAGAQLRATAEEARKRAMSGFYELIGLGGDPDTMSFHCTVEGDDVRLIMTMRKQQD